MWRSVNNTTDLSHIILDADFDDVVQRLIQIAILLVISGFGFLLNTLVIVMLCRKVRSNIDLLILHLGLSDILVAGFCALADAIWKVTYQWLAGDFLCKFIKYMQMLSLYASTFIIVVISLDRCIVITNPFMRIDQHLVVRLMITFAWIAAAVCSIPQVGC